MIEPSNDKGNEYRDIIRRIRDLEEWKHGHQLLTSDAEAGVLDRLDKLEARVTELENK